MVLLPNDVPKLSGSPRSNPSAGKRSDAAILVFWLLDAARAADASSWKTKSTA